MSQTEKGNTTTETTATVGKNRNTIVSRLRSWAVWLSVLGAVGIILNAVGLFDKWGINGTAWDVIINAFGSILVGFGILNNPTDSKSF